MSVYSGPFLQVQCHEIFRPKLLNTSIPFGLLIHIPNDFRIVKDNDSTDNAEPGRLLALTTLNQADDWPGQR